jgi:hypothetical protein
LEIIKAFAFERIGKLLPSYTKKMTKSSQVLKAGE